MTTAPRATLQMLRLVCAMNSLYARNIQVYLVCFLCVTAVEGHLANKAASYADWGHCLTLGLRISAAGHHTCSSVMQHEQSSSFSYWTPSTGLSIQQRGGLRLLSTYTAYELQHQQRSKPLSWTPVTWSCSTMMSWTQAPKQTLAPKAVN